MPLCRCGAPMAAEAEIGHRLIFDRRKQGDVVVSAAPFGGALKKRLILFVMMRIVRSDRVLHPPRPLRDERQASSSIKKSDVKQV